MLTAHHPARATRVQYKPSLLAKRMLLWNGACGGIALFIYLTEKLAA